MNLWNNIDSRWIALKHTWQESCGEVLGKRKITQKDWLLAETWNLITQRKRLKVEIGRCNEQDKKSSLTLIYQQFNMNVTTSTKKDNKEFYNTLATEDESTAGQGDMKRLYDITRTISGERSSHHSQLRARKVLPSLQSKNKGQDGWNISATFLITTTHRNAKHHC